MVLAVTTPRRALCAAKLCYGVGICVNAARSKRGILGINTLGTNTLFTIGYEGTVVGDLLDTLRGIGVQTLIDIRDVPVSRRPGFSKSALTQHARDHGIEYAHIRALGDPKEGREAARSGKHEQFRSIFTAHLGGPDAQAALNDAIAIASRSVACLLCYERDHHFCHRALVAAEMNRLGGFPLRHIGVPQRR